MTDRSTTLRWLATSLCILISLGFVVTGLAGSMLSAAGVVWGSALSACLVMLASRLALRIGRTSLAAVKPVRTVSLSPENSRSDIVIAVPVILRSATDVDAVVRSAGRLLGGGGAGYPIRFLIDLPDSSSRCDPRDTGLLRQLSKLPERLASEFGTAAAVIDLMVRERRLEIEEGVWRGWERKRGKLREFFAWLNEAADTSFGITPAPVPKARYVFVADLDTSIEPGCLETLHAAACQSTGEEYAVFSPSIRYEDEAAPSLFQRLKTLHWYPKINVHQPESDNQRLFGRDLYFGKALIDAAAFERAMPQAVPDNRLLSHDHFESYFARVRHVGAACVSEPCPSQLGSWLRRQHRWVRGDIQTAVMLARFRGPLWAWAQCAETLLGQIAPIAAFFAIAIILSMDAGETGSAVLLVAGLYSAGLVLMPLELLAAARSQVVATPGDGRRSAVNHTVAAMGGALVDGLLLYVNARTNMLAILQTCGCFMFRRRGFLAWGDNEARGRFGWIGWIPDAGVAAILTGSAVLNPSTPVVAAAALVVIWLGAPLSISMAVEAGRLPGRNPRSRKRRPAKVGFSRDNPLASFNAE